MLFAPDTFLLSPLATPAQWPHLRASLGAPLLQVVFGGLPPSPDGTRAELLHRAELPQQGVPVLESWRVQCGSDALLQFGLQVLRPRALAAWPVVLCGDGCWNYIDDTVKRGVLEHGFALAWFNRCEVMPDPPQARRDTRAGLYQRHPGAAFGALAAWAWAYHRAVDAIGQMEGLNPQRIAVVGHSRGGKAALLAGATDTRIWLTAANNSGTAGAASYRPLTKGCESLLQLAQAFPHWLGAGMTGVAGQTPLPGDQHLLLAGIAPRALMITQATDDLWANPAGTQYTLEQLRALYQWLGHPNALAAVWREGGHAQRWTDWQALLDFAATCL